MSTEKPKKLYRVLAGLHSQMEPTPDGRGKRIKEVLDSDTGKVIGYDHTYAPLIPRAANGNRWLEVMPGFDELDQYFESHIDMVKQFGRDKFALVSQDEFEKIKAAAEVPVPA